MSVALATDDRFRIGLLATVRSAARTLSAGARLDVNVMDCGLSNPDEVVAVLESNCPENVRVRIRSVDPERLGHFHSHRDRLSLATFARLLAPTLLGDLDRVIYLDSDLIVRRDLLKLWKADLDGAPIGACRDPYFRFLGEDVRNCLELGVDPLAPYFSAGVLLVDLQKWREENAEEYLIQAGQPGYINGQHDDQSLLNVYFAGRCRWVSLPWNQLRFHWNRTACVAPILPGIVHVGGALKPWHFRAEGATGVNSVYQDLMMDAVFPAEWLPEQLLENPRLGVREVFQTAKLIFRALPTGDLMHVPFVLREVRRRFRQQARFAIGSLGG